MINLDVLEQHIENKGFYIAENLLDQNTVASLKKSTELAIEKEVSYQGTKNYDLFGTIQVCPMYGGSFIDLLNYRALVEPFNK